MALDNRRSYAGVRIVVNFRELMKDQAGPSCVVTKM